MPEKKRGTSEAAIVPACTAFVNAVRMSRASGLSPASGWSVRSITRTFFFPARAAT